MVSRADLAANDRVALQRKVAFLKQRGSYPEHALQVSAIETHMSWVFLTDEHAYKLKKPVRYAYLDFSTIDARRRDCLEEVRLNRRLAPDVYLGVVPLARTVSGQLELNGDGQVEDWLVMMRRLPEQRMLDRLIAQRAVASHEIDALVTILVGFYRGQPHIKITPAAYRQQLIKEAHTNARQLAAPQYQLAADQIDSITRAQLQVLEQQAALFECRAREGKIVEAHGDLRPEHICLEATPVVIDCLEFNRNFRILDVADELAFLAMECERLGAAAIARQIFDRYRASGFDDPPETLVHFYKSYRGCLRAKLAVWHLDEPEVANRAKWLGMAQQYLAIAQQHTGYLA